MPKIDILNQDTWFLREDWLDVPEEKRPTLKSFCESLKLPFPEKGSMYGQLVHSFNNVTAPCVVCGSFVHKEQLVIVVDENDRILTLPCMCHSCLGKQNEAKKGKAMSKEDNACFVMKQEGFPVDVLNARFSSFDCRHVLDGHNIVNTMISFISGRPMYEGQEPMRAVVLLGKPGTGKTHLMASAAYSYLIEHPFKAIRYTTEVKMLNDIKDAMRTKEGSASIKALYAGCDVLFLDEVGRSRNTSYNFEATQEIIQERLDRGFKTVIAGNITPEDFASRMDEHIVSRIVGHGAIISIDGEDYRTRRN